VLEGASNAIVDVVDFRAGVAVDLCASPHNRTTLRDVRLSTVGYPTPVRRLSPIAHGVAIVGGALVILGWVLGGFRAPDGDGQWFLLAGIALGLFAEAGVWAATRRE
jgi:hypothetical protein